MLKTFDARGNGDGDTANTMTGDHQSRITDYTALAIAENQIGRKPENGPNGIGISEESAYTQNTTGTMGVAVLPDESDGSDQSDLSDGKTWNKTVRRLMPVECERLMGFPDNWTRIPWRGKPAEQCPDGPRYKACGNSMCVNVMRWIGMRIELVERKMKREEGGK